MSGIRSKQTSLFRTKREMCETNSFMLYQCETTYQWPPIVDGNTMSQELQTDFLLLPACASPHADRHEPQAGLYMPLNQPDPLPIQCDKWDSAAIEKRQEMMAKLARKVWEMPERSKEAAE